MRARRLTQWAPHFRAPARSQWRSGPAPPVGRFSSSNAPHGKRRPRRAAQAVPQPSIFEQLFPPETLPPSHARAPDLKTSRSRDGEVTGVGGEVGEDARLERGDAAVWERMREEEEEEEWNGPREEAILVVRNGSKSTLPSDFYRVAPRGEHLDGRGWSSMQAVQARHPDTLEPLDKYLLHFPTPTAAATYKHELERLVTSPSPPESRLTLQPPDPASLSIQLVRGANPVDRVAAARVPKDILRRGLDTRNLVHVKLEGSQLTLGEMGALVEGDGRGRNLAWKLKESWGEGGISVSLKGGPPPVKKVEMPEFVEEGAELDDAAGVPEGSEAPPDFFSRFFLSFQSVHDARRFIRSWHRRALNVHDDEYRACIVNASLIW